MPSAIQKKSYGSATVFWLNRELLLEEVESAARDLLGDVQNAEKVVLFGSLAEDRATAFSDADLLIVVEGSEKRFIDRPEEFRPYFEEVDVEVDLFVYTREEISETPFAGMISSKSGCIVYE